MACLNGKCIDLDVTTQPQGVKTYLQKPIKTVGSIGLVPCSHGSQQPYYVSKECHFLAGAGTLIHFGTWRRGTHPNLLVLQAVCNGKSLPWLFWPGEAIYTPPKDAS